MTTTRPAHAIAVQLYLGRTRGTTVPTVYGVTVPKQGYVVALPNYGIVVKQPTVEAIQAWVETVLPHTLSGLTFVGVGSWLHDGTTFLDVVQVFPEFAVASAKAKLWSEFAIYDLAQGQSIVV
jgi:hypothetical protein